MSNLQHRCHDSPLGALARGLLAGAVGTAAMTDMPEATRDLVLEGSIEGAFVRPVGTYELARVTDGTRVRFALVARLQSFRRPRTPVIQRAIEMEVANLPYPKVILERRDI